MTTIRISRLPEIQNDRVSSDDFLIINDGDIVTSKVRFEEFCFAIGAQDLEFTGDILYTGDVVFEGDVTGDFYNKDQTYSKAEIDQIVSNLNDYNILQDARITAIETLIGRPSLSTHLGAFPGGIIPNNSTIVVALETLEHWVMENRVRIEQIELDIIGIKGDIIDIKQDLESIHIIIDGLGGIQPPDIDARPPDGILNQLAWLIAKVDDHEDRITDLEKLMGSCDISGLAGDPSDPTGDGSVTCALVDHEDRLGTTEELGAINDAENANLVALSGVGTNPGQVVEGQEIVYNNLGTFTYNIVPNASFNETFSASVLDGTNIKFALQETVDEMRTRAPITSPVFSSSIKSGQEYGITGPALAPSLIPMYHASPGALSNYTHANDDTKNSCEGAFAYTRTNSGYGGSTQNGATQGRAWFRNQNEWVELLSTINPGAIWEVLGLQIAINDADASARGVPSGYIYIQKDNLNDPDEQGMLKTNGVNTASNPRPIFP